MSKKWQKLVETETRLRRNFVPSTIEGHKLVDLSENFERTLLSERAFGSLTSCEEDF
jgi:hypothetical protein